MPKVAPDSACKKCGGYLFDWDVDQPVCSECHIEVDVVVCGEASHFGDDVWTDCSKCGKAICHRPYVPDKPKVCLECMNRHYENENKAG